MDMWTIKHKQMRLARWDAAVALLAVAAAIFSLVTASHAYRAGDLTTAMIQLACMIGDIAAATVLTACAIINYRRARAGI